MVGDLVLYADGTDVACFVYPNLKNPHLTYSLLNGVIISYSDDVGCPVY